ncbi:inactive protein RESTRICTED TEV MOVEMENT 2-like [Quillaja saponaria]|uniref:Inactive protein RESTRICTED TEV MOVEMENT 2-like n=1 Tax=Quillaja saponaria TaxID=32244 RepID=A0AAD7QJ67_QUISA|nr:inactive protein RESTRICTED TEV MOVEMENT 2-like [Quillaja saponaria]
MAMRQRSSPITAWPLPVERLLYEDFQPKSEMKEDSESHVVLLQLPGFEKDMIKIICVHSTLIVRVLGERLIENNKWIRFNQAFSIPDNCDIDKIYGMFEQGLLKVIMPKKIVSSKIAPKEVKTKQEPPTTSKPAPDAELPKPEIVQKKLNPPKSSSVTDIKHEKAPLLSSPPKPNADFKPQKGQQEIPIKTTFTSDSINEIFEKNEVKEANRKHSMSRKHEKAEESKEFTFAAGISIPKTSEKDKDKFSVSDEGKDLIDAKEKVVIKEVIASAAEAITRLAKNFNDEDKQMLANMGAAILVIVVALWAFVF